MLTRREVTAIFLAASTAPVVTCAVFASLRLFSITATVACLAAFVIGAPLFAYLRHRRWSLALRSLVAAATAGLVSALSLAALVFLALPPRDFSADPGPALSLIGIAIAWGVGLGLISGTALWLIMRRGSVSLTAA